MKDIFIRKSYQDEGGSILIYLQFHGEYAVKQLEISEDHIVMLTTEHPIDGHYFLYDQNFSDINWDSNDFITEEDFNKVWDKIASSNHD